MTNGEKLQSIFPNIIKYGNILIDDTGALQKNILFDDTWWNAEYKEPTTKNDSAVDCIDRAEVLKLMKDNWHTHNGDWAMQESMDDIRALPSVTPIRPKGHWIGIDEEPYEVWECDHCGFVIDGSGCVDPYDYRDTYKFCPHCGAKMESEEK